MGRSAGKIVGGLTLLLVGAFVWLNARLTTIDDGGADGPGVWAVVGVVGALLGLALLLYGVWQLATNVDVAAQVAARALHAQQQEDAVADARRREQERRRGGAS